MSGQILTGKEVATKIKQEVKIELEKIKEKGINPKLVAIQVGENSSSLHLRDGRRGAVTHAAPLRPTRRR